MNVCEDVSWCVLGMNGCHFGIVDRKTIRYYVRV